KFPHVGEEGGSWADMAVYAINLSTYVGQNLYIELCDEPATTWAHAFFDDVVTYYPTAPDYANGYDEVIDGGQAAVSADEKVTVRINWVLAQSRLQVVNGSFEQGNLTGWTPVTEGWQQDANGNYVGVKRASTYNADYELPYNQTGSYLLEGTSTGFDEAETWTVRSSTFTLLGSGWITVKMGGNAAAVKVYKANGTLIGYYKQTRFNDDQDKFPHVGEEGGSWADMAVYAIDLSAYIGEDLYIELCDEEVGEGEYGWAFFDDAIVYYAAAPDWENSYNSVNDGGQKGVSNRNKVKVQIKWVLAHNSLDD
ncbi:MAG: hypothetical protein J6Z34_07375, partial [Clostridia bacterium]|nr:hypothetical protein [Clostridia bacterium]